MAWQEAFRVQSTEEHVLLEQDEDNVSDGVHYSEENIPMTPPQSMWLMRRWRGGLVVGVLVVAGFMATVLMPGSSASKPVIADVLPHAGQQSMVASLTDATLPELEQELAGNRFCRTYVQQTGCAWTADYSCPTTRPQGKLGVAQNDQSLGYNCCCARGFWKLSIKAQTDKTAVELAPAPTPPHTTEEAAEKADHSALPESTTEEEPEEKAEESAPLEEVAEKESEEKAEKRTTSNQDADDESDEKKDDRAVEKEATPDATAVEDVAKSDARSEEAKHDATLDTSVSKDGKVNAGGEANNRNADESGRNHGDEDDGGHANSNETDSNEDKHHIDDKQAGQVEGKQTDEKTDAANADKSD